MRTSCGRAATPGWFRSPAMVARPGATSHRRASAIGARSPSSQLSVQIGAEEGHLCQPQTAIRLRRSENSDTPLPPEVPAGENPATGAVIDYLLKATPADVITLEILDGAGKLIRKFSSSEQPPRPDKPPAIADYWFKPAAPLGKKAGLNRFVWELRYPPPPTIETS